MRKLLPTLALLGALVLAPSMAQAQTESTAATATVTVQEYLSISIDEETIEFGTVNSPGTYSPTVGSPALVSHAGNVTYSVFLRADDATWTGGTDTKPASDLEFNQDAGSWVELTDTDYALRSAIQPGSYPDDISLDWQLTINETDETGSYSLPMTISAVVD